MLDLRPLIDRHPRTLGMVMGGIWLGFLAFAIPQIAHTTTGISRVIAFGLMAAFVVIYLWAIGYYGPYIQPEMRRGQILRVAVLIVIMLASGAVTGPGAFIYFPYVVAAAANGLWPPANYIAGGALMTAGVVASYALGYDPMETGVVFTGALFVMFALSVFLTTRELAESEMRADVAAARERTRIASDVHDLLGHSLTVVNLKLQVVDRLMSSDPERAHRELSETRQIVAEALANVRQTVSMERGRTLNQALDSARETLEGAGVHTTVEGDPAHADAAISLVLAWVVREATTNILRHAHASQARITVAPGLLTVDDDGDGVAAKEGNGIRGMRERVATAKGTLRVATSDLGGTRVEVTW